MKAKLSKDQFVKMYIDSYNKCFGGAEKRKTETEILFLESLGLEKSSIISNEKGEPIKVKL